MYRFIGYMIKNEFGDSIQFVKTKEECTQICQQNGIPTERMKQIFELENVEVDDTIIK